MRKLTFPCFAILLSILACNFPISNNYPVYISTNIPPITSPSESSTPLPIVIPTVDTSTFPTITPNPIVHGIELYRTDFQTGWPSINTEHGNGSSTEYGYNFSLTNESLWGNWVYSTTNEVSTGFIEIKFTFTTCNDTLSNGGMIFHYMSPEQFKYFTFNCDGMFLIVDRISMDEALTILSGKTTNIPDIENTEITLGLDIRSNTTSIYINNELLGVIDSPNTTSGDVGLYIQTQGGETTILFSELTVYE